MLRLTQFILLALLISSVSFAAVPQMINYQGHLASPGGTPVNGPVDMTFTIYNAATSGTSLWTEDQTVQVNNGIYAVALGAINSIDPAIIDGDLWLSVKVGTDTEMTPRQKLNSVPFAMTANSLASGSQLENICILYDRSKMKRPDFCPELAVKVVFASSQKYTGDLGGLAGADITCQTLASNAGLTGNFKAWLSEQGVSGPDNRFTKNNLPYVLPNGDWIADNWSDLVDGQLHFNINVDETGNPLIPYVNNNQIFAWSGTSDDGTAGGTAYYNNCNNWTASSDAISNGGYVGIAEMTRHRWMPTLSPAGGSWTNSNGISCEQQHHLYCFEQ